MTEWHFDKHRKGWSWRCTTDDGTVESIHCFPDIRDAIADAALHGYVSGMSRIGSMGPVAKKRSQRARLSSRAQSPHAQLVFRRNLQVRWIWELRSPDGHLLNRSTRDYATREDCEADARANGQMVDSPSAG